MKPVESTLIFKLTEELRAAVSRCPNCQGAREYVFISRGRENMVPCVRCEPIFKLLEPLEVALEILET